MAERRRRTGSKVTFINSATCGLYKNGKVRYKVGTNGRRTTDVDNQLGDDIDGFLANNVVPGLVQIDVAEVFRSRVLVPRYYDMRWLDDFRALVEKDQLETASLGDLEDDGIILVRGGHGSPSNDVRAGTIPYIKVSDLRSLRVNVNPTNLVSESIAELFWGGKTSRLQEWDLITPNRASSNIGEFAVLLPAEERIVITKEVFILRILTGHELGWTPFYLHWALCLRAVRRQWQRVVLMQTNREDVADRYREILVPVPKSLEWAQEVSAPFASYFTSLATARVAFVEGLTQSGFEYIASAQTVGSAAVAEESVDEAEKSVEEP